MTCASRDEFDNLTADGLTPHEIESLHVFNKYVESFNSLLEEYIEDGMSYAEAYELAVYNANGHDNCRVHTSGGAIFWFTIMTTIGYGNTAPTTTGGRCLQTNCHLDAFIAC